ncbi:glycoside hydrolase family 172 protein [Bacteroides sp.]
MKNFIGVFKVLPIACLLFSCQSKKEVSLSSLLEEMCDREALAKFPAPAYTTAQYSSYDRASVRKDTSSWYANWDRSQFLRVESDKGRREFVMFDAEGPGAVVRFWVTVGDYSDKGIIRFYLDGDSLPAIEGEALKLISGGLLVGSPLSESVSELTEYKQRGHNLYFPIPYARHCKITYESSGIKEPGEKSGECFYYNINYRTYEPGTKVKTFTKADLQSVGSLLDTVKLKLENPSNVLSGLDEKSGKMELVDGTENKISFEGSGAIQKLTVKLNAQNLPQALRSTVLRIKFDDHETVWAPVGDFFGSGSRLSPYCTFYTEVSADTVFSCFWVMPYKEKCDVSLVNTGNEPVSTTMSVTVSPWKWDARSMYFGAGWTEYQHLYTGAKRDMKGTSDQFDVNFVELTGKGVYVGDGITLFNPVGDWWGEGDEKIYVDHEPFPSHFGTGTEDYYGYAWCMPNRFDHPFIAEPDGSGNLEPGHVVNVRFRALDAIPFCESLRFDMEIWHWASTYINYAPITFFYMLPGGNANRVAEPDKTRQPVVLHKNDLVSNIPDSKGIVEGENLDIVLTGGEEKSQTIPFMNWSNHAQFFWKDSRMGDEALLGFCMPESGTFRLRIRLTMARDYGKYSISLNNRELVASFDAYAENLTTQILDLGHVALKQGDNYLRFTQLKPNRSAINNYLGVDCLLIEK